MRFKLKNNEIKVGKKTKIVEKFLWRPLKIGDDLRWLEKAKIEYQLRFVPLNDGTTCSVFKFVAIRFID